MLRFIILEDILMKEKFLSFWIRKRKAIITILIVVVAAWILGQIAVPAIMKEIFLGGHIA